MPLIIMTGFPSSGKTTRSEEIKNFFEQRCKTENKKLRIHVVNDESLGISKLAYKDAREEKKARGALMSAVERLVSKDDLVIADGMNYIKGFRYQLYCVARAISTPHCVVHCGTPINLARQWNSEREEGAYPEDVFNELISRYEEPDGRNRWDSPLFTVIYDDLSVPKENLWDAVILKKPPPPNLSTVTKPVSETNFLYELDKMTLDVINCVLETQKNQGQGGAPMAVPRSSHKVINPVRTITMSELRRHRRQFTTMNKLHTSTNIDVVADMFVDYLNTNLAN
ncbi:chromatin associated protein KTI12 [Umbelopsis sp. PMI_123]|nr:chromatin associated protein KTI12 [Umbelopsis sp. PMI_123]